MAVLPAPSAATHPQGPENSGDYSGDFRSVPVIFRDFHSTLRLQRPQMDCGFLVVFQGG